MLLDFLSLFSLCNGVSVLGNDMSNKLSSKPSRKDRPRSTGKQFRQDDSQTHFDISGYINCFFYLLVVYTFYVPFTFAFEITNF